MDQAQVTQLCISAVVDAVSSNNQMLAAQVCESNLTSGSLQQLTHEWTASDHEHGNEILYEDLHNATSTPNVPPGYSYVVISNNFNVPTYFQGQSVPVPDPSPTGVTSWNSLVNPYQALQVILTDESTGNSSQAQTDMNTFISLYLAPLSSGGVPFLTNFSSNLLTQVLSALNGAWNPATNSNSSEEMSTIQSVLSMVTADGTNETTPYQTMLRNIISSIQQNPSMLSTIAQIGSAMNNANQQTITLLNG